MTSQADPHVLRTQAVEWLDLLVLNLITQVYFRQRSSTHMLSKLVPFLPNIRENCLPIPRTNLGIHFIHIQRTQNHTNKHLQERTHNRIFQTQFSTRNTVQALKKEVYHMDQR